jgi:hypothetical protein
MSYRESDAEEAGIKAHYAAVERKRQESLTWEQKVFEGMQAEEFRLNAELKKLQDIAAKIPRTENQILYHRDKMAKFKEANGL